MASKTYFSSFLEIFDVITHLCGLETCTDHLIHTLQYLATEKRKVKKSLAQSFLDFVLRSPCNRCRVNVSLLHWWKSSHSENERLVLCSLAWAVEMGMYGTMRFMASSLPLLRVWSDHYIFSSTDMSINFFVFLFLLPHPASKGNASATKVTWRTQYTSIFAFGMNGEPTRGKWGDGELAGSWVLPLPQADGMRSSCV